MTYRAKRIAGRPVEFIVDGPPDAPELLVFHLGSPSAAVRFPALAAAAARRGVRTLIYSRGGYGRSARQPGRVVADEARITAALADALGYARFYTAGWSGGGPPALACAALLPEQVRACLLLASPSPWHEAGKAWEDWTTAEDSAERQVLASAAAESLVPEFELESAELATASPDWLRRWPTFGDADRRTLRRGGGVAAPLARSMRRAVSSGTWGWFDDNVARAVDWGFRVASIRVPVVVRHGELDRLVDVRHGRWLAARIRGARAEIVPGGGHGSIVEPFDELIATLLAAERDFVRGANITGR